MRTKRYLLLLAAICISLFLTNCSKDGAVGPQGTTGEKGDQGLIGPAGPKGANGKAGSNIYSGKVVPPASIGVEGDYYINTTTGFLYGPKTANGWGTGYSLKGPSGATGTAGSKTLSGAGAPPTTLGSNGDYYLDKTNYLLYGPKSSTGWGAAISLRGPAGTANVIYSDWAKPTAWTFSTVFDTYHFTFDIPASHITQAILDKGTVLVYAKLNGYNISIWPINNVALMPIMITYRNGGGGIIYNDFWSAIYSLGKVQIDFTDDQNYYKDPSYVSINHYFRYVIIPGGVHATSFKDINFKDYNEVKQAFHLTE